MVLKTLDHTALVVGGDLKSERYDYDMVNGWVREYSIICIESNLF